MSGGDFWSKRRVTVRGQLYNVEVDAWQHGSNLALAVTPTVAGADDISTTQFGITHVASGVRLWPDSLALERAKALCLELLRVPGWATAMPTDTRWRDAIETIARRYLAPSPAATQLM